MHHQRNSAARVPWDTGGEQISQECCKSFLVQLLLWLPDAQQSCLEQPWSSALHWDLKLANRESSSCVRCKGLSSSCWKLLYAQELIFSSSDQQALNLCKVACSVPKALQLHQDFPAPMGVCRWYHLLQNKPSPSLTAEALI